MVISGRRHLPLSWTPPFCLLLGCVSVESIITTVGEDVTLPCSYDAQTHGSPPVCWGRGALSYWDCSNEVIKSDGTSVTSRLSNRYLLLGHLDEGDVSLTIRRVEESDSGMYSCRVEIPGWFNDHKHEVILTVVPAPPRPLKIETREVKERTITVRWSPVFDGGRPITSYRIYLKHKVAPWDTANKTEVSNPELTQLTLVDLRPAKTFRLRMFAVNSVGRSEASNVLTVTTKEAAPEGPPLDMQLEALTSNSIKVTWKPPRGDLRNGVLQSYSVSYRVYDPAGGPFKRWQQQSVTATRELESVVLSNLEPATNYSIHIRARTNAGVGPASTDLCSTLDEGSTSPAATSGFLDEFNFQAVMRLENALSPVQGTSRVETVRTSSATTSFSSEVLTTSTFTEADPQLFSVGISTTLEKFKSLLGVGNIGRVAAIFFFTIIIILVFIFRTRFVPKDSSQHAENIYDNVQKFE